MHVSNADDMEWQRLMVDAVVPLKNAKRLWRIHGADLNVYFCDIPTVAEMLQKALADRQILKAGVSRDAQGREWILSAAVTDEKSESADVNSGALRKGGPHLLF